MVSQDTCIQIVGKLSFLYSVTVSIGILFEIHSFSGFFFFLKSSNGFHLIYFKLLSLYVTLCK